MLNESTERASAGAATPPPLLRGDDDPSAPQQNSSHPTDAIARAMELMGELDHIVSELPSLPTAMPPAPHIRSDSRGGSRPRDNHDNHATTDGSSLLSPPHEREQYLNMLKRGAVGVDELKEKHEALQRMRETSNLFLAREFTEPDEEEADFIAGKLEQYESNYDAIQRILRRHEGSADDEEDFVTTDGGNARTVSRAFSTVQQQVSNSKQLQQTNSRRSISDDAGDLLLLKRRDSIIAHRGKVIPKKANNNAFDGSTSPMSADTGISPGNLDSPGSPSLRFQTRKLRDAQLRSELQRGFDEKLKNAVKIARDEAQKEGRREGVMRAATVLEKQSAELDDAKKVAQKKGTEARSMFQRQLALEQKFVRLRDERASAVDFMRKYAGLDLDKIISEHQQFKEERDYLYSTSLRHVPDQVLGRAGNGSSQQQPQQQSTSGVKGGSNPHASWRSPMAAIRVANKRDNSNNYRVWLRKIQRYLEAMSSTVMQLLDYDAG